MGFPVILCTISSKHFQGPACVTHFERGSCEFNGTARGQAQGGTHPDRIIDRNVISHDEPCLELTQEIEAGRFQPVRFVDCKTTTLVGIISYWKGLFVEYQFLPWPARFQAAPS